MSKKAKKPASGFKKGFRIYLILLAVVFLAALAVIWVMLSRYQADQDAKALAEQKAAEAAAHELAVHRAPQLAFEDFLAGMTAEYWTEQWFAANPGSFDKADQVTERMEELFFDEDFRYWKAEEYTDEAPAYILKNGSDELALVTLAGEDVNWSVSDVSLRLSGECEASMEVPAGCTVYCNGTALGEEYAENDVSYFEMEDYADDLVDPILWTTYSVSGQLFEPTLTAEAPADRTLVTAEDGSCSYILSAEAAEPYQQEAENFVLTLLHYYMMGGNNTQGNMWAALQCVVRDSQAYTLIYETYNGVTWDTPYPDSTYEAHAGDVTIWAENCVSLDVAYHAEGTAQGYTNVADGTYRIYFLDMGEGFGIYGLTYG